MASSLHGEGQVDLYDANFDASVSDELKKILAKPVDDRSSDERQQVEAYHTADVTRLATISCGTSMYALAFASNQLVAAGRDGGVRLIDPASGTLLGEFMPFPVEPTSDLPSARRHTLARPHCPPPHRARNLPLRAHW